MDEHVDDMSPSQVTRSAISLVLLLCCTALLSAQQGSIRFSSIGDPQNRVRSRPVRGLYQDQRGYMWFTTNWTLYRHDGVDTIEVLLHDRTTGEKELFRPRSAAEDSEGQLYFSSVEGLSHINDCHDCSTLLRTDYFDRSSEIAFDSQDRLWCVHRGAIYCFRSPDDLRPFMTTEAQDLPGQAVSILRVGADRICVGLAGGWILVLGRGGEEEFRLSLSDEEQLPPKIHTQLRPRTDDSLWALVGGRCFEVDLKSRTSSRLTVPEELAQGVTAVLLDQGKRTWLGTRQGLHCLTTAGTTVYGHDPMDPHTLPSDRVLALIQDRSGVIWTATSGGLVRFDGRWPRFEFRSAKSAESPPGSGVTRCTMRDSGGRTWLGGANSGLVVFDGPGLEHRRIELPSSERKSSGTLVSSLMELDDGKILVGGTAAEYFIVDPETEEVSRHLLPNPLAELELCRDMIRDQRGNIWIGTAQRLIELDERGHVTGREHALPYRSTAPARLMPGSLRRMTDGRILGIANPDYLIVLSASGQQLQGVDLGLRKSAAAVLSVEEIDSEHLLVGSSRGLAKFDMKHGDYKPLQLHSHWGRAYINSIGKDSEGRFWISGRNYGLAALSPDAQEILREFRSENGLYSENFYLGASWHSNDRELLAFGTAEGALYFRPADVLVTGVGPSVDITRVSIVQDHETRAWDWQEGRLLELDYNEGSILIDFVAMDYVAPSANTYEYRIKEDEGPFIDSGRHNSAVFSNLQPGRHTIQFRAKNADGFRSERATELVVKVFPPFWMTWWFRAVLVALSLLAVLGLIQLRTKTIHKRNLLLTEEIARRRNTEQELRESQARLESILETMPYEFWIMDLDRIFRHQNALSVSQDGNWCGMSLDEVMSLHPQRREHWETQIDAALKGKQSRGEAKIIGSDEDREVIKLISPLLIGSRIKGVFGLTIDISDLRQAQREAQDLETKLLQAQKIEALGLLAGGVAHDFNNILTGIKGSAELGIRALNEEVVSLSDLRKDLEAILSCSKRATAITGQLLSFSRVDSVSSPAVDLREVMNRFMGYAGPLLGKDIKFEVVIEEDTRPVRADALRLEQVLMNLISNSKRALSDRGIIEVSIRNAECSANEVEICVRDEGHGMTPEILERVFVPFFTTSADGNGTGLGLATSKRIVEDFGGEISALSSPGEGSVFRVRLPAAIPGVLQPEALRAVVSLREASVSNLVKTVLEQTGHIVLTHFGADAALEALADEVEEPTILVGDRRFLLPPISRLLGQLSASPSRHLILVLLEEDEELPDNSDLPRERFNVMRTPFSRPKLAMVLAAFRKGVGV